jgi:hypothetical protein
LTYRPPNYESPLVYWRTPITPNDEFFVRYHLADIPEVDASTWKLNIGGEGANRDVQIGFDALNPPSTSSRSVNAREINADWFSRMSRACNGAWRDGLRAMEGRPPQGGARLGWAQ